MLDHFSYRIVNFFERINRYFHVFLLILSRHDPFALGLESHIHFSNNVINCSKVQQNATQFKYIERNPNLGKNRLQTPKKIVFYAYVKVLGNKNLNPKT
jgi:hypothetical protein